MSDPQNDGDIFFCWGPGRCEILTFLRNQTAGKQSKRDSDCSLTPYLDVKRVFAASPASGHCLCLLVRQNVPSRMRGRPGSQDSSLTLPACGNNLLPETAGEVNAELMIHVPRISPTTFHRFEMWWEAKTDQTKAAWEAQEENSPLTSSSCASQVTC